MKTEMRHRRGVCKRFNHNLWYQQPTSPIALKSQRDAITYSILKTTLGLLFALMSQLSAADVTFRPYVGASLAYDSNFLRLSNYVTPQQFGVNSKGSFIENVMAGLNMDWAISQQHLIIQAQVNQNWFSTFGMLDYLGYKTLAQWNWQVGSLFKGQVGYSNDYSMGSYAQLNALIANTYTTEKYFANGTYNILLDWYLTGSFARNSLSYSQLSRQVSNRNENVAQVKLDYQGILDTQLGLDVSLSNGYYPDRTAATASIYGNNYNRYIYNLNWSWQYSVKTRFYGEVGYTQFTIPDAGVYNFSGFTGNLGLNWEATSKVQFMLNGWRRLSQYDTVQSSFILTQGIRITPTWLATPKITLGIPISYQQLDYLGQPPGATFTETDKLTDIGINLSYQLTHNVEVSSYYQFESRSSNLLTRNYKDETLGINMQVEF
jgi:hypothetical protein